MLNVLRQHSRSTIISILFAVLIAAFVISLIPGQGCLGKNKQSISNNFHEYAVQVGDIEVSRFELFMQAEILQAQQEMQRQEIVKKLKGLQDESFLKQYGFGKSAGELYRIALDQLIQEALFANEAKRIQLLASQEEAAKLIAKWEEGYYQFMQNRLKAVGMSSSDLVESQKKAILARKLIDLYQASITIPATEVKASFDLDHRQVKVQYVRFSHREIEKTLLPSEEELAQFAKENQDQIKKDYEARKASYQKQEPQVQLHHILISVKKDAKPEELEAAKKKADAILARLQNKEHFRVVAKEVSEDQATKDRGGNLGFRKKGSTGLTKEQEEKIFAAKTGDLIGPEKTDVGFQIWQVGDFRQGDISFEKAQMEIAERFFYEQKPKQLVKQAAEETVKKLQAGATLAALFPGTKEESSSKEQPKNINKVEETDFISEKSSLTQQGILGSKELGKEAFAKKTGEFIGSFGVFDGHIVAVVKDKKDPESKEFEKQKETIFQTLKKEKGNYLQKEWGQKLCLDLKAAGRIKINPDIIPSLQYTVEEQNGMNKLPSGVKLPSQLQNQMKPNTVKSAPPYELCSMKE